MPRIAVDNLPPAAVPRPQPVSPAPAPAKAASDLDNQLKESSGTSLLAAFSAFPENITFSDEEEGETILLLLRAHIITNVPWILITLGALLVPLIIIPLLGAAGLGSAAGPGTIITFVLVWYLGIFTYAFLNFLYWYFNVYLVTNERIVDVDWYSVIYKKVSSCQIAKIQDVSASQGGVFAGLFDFGNVQIQTAGEEENFEFTNVPHPQLVAKKIEELVQKEEKEWEPKPNA